MYAYIIKIKYPNIIYQILTTMPLSDDAASPWIEGDPLPIEGSSVEGPQTPSAADERAEPQKRGLIHDLAKEMRVRLGLEFPDE